MPEKVEVTMGHRWEISRKRSPRGLITYKATQAGNSAAFSLQISGALDAAYRGKTGLGLDVFTLTADTDVSMSLVGQITYVGDWAEIP